jgi:hypothetical protein
VTNAEKRQRRRQAALEGAETRQARLAQAQAPEPQPVADRPAPIAAPPRPDPLPAAPSARDLLARARVMGREADLFYRAHLARWPHRPGDWTDAQRLALAAFLDKFIRPDGTPQPVPNCRRRSR